MSNNITRERTPMLKPSKQVREFTAMQFRQSKSYKLLHKFLLKTSSVRLHALRLALYNHRSPLHCCPVHLLVRSQYTRVFGKNLRVFRAAFSIFFTFIFSIRSVYEFVSSYFSGPHFFFHPTCHCCCRSVAATSFAATEFFTFDVIHCWCTIHCTRM